MSKRNHLSHDQVIDLYNILGECLRKNTNGEYIHPGGKVVYKDGWDDEKVVEHAAKKLGRAINLQNVQHLRNRRFGPILSKEGPAPNQHTKLQGRVDKVETSIAAVESSVSAIEDTLTAPHGVQARLDAAFRKLHHLEDKVNTALIRRQHLQAAE